jgi:hypothetical protein
MVPTAGERALLHLQFLHTGDPAEDQILDAFVQGMSTGLERATQVAHGTDDAEGERVLTDPRVCPFWALPHAALWTGSRMPLRPFGMSDPDWETYARAYVVAALPAYRGGSVALRTVAQRFLTGTKSVKIITRYDGELWDTLVITRPDETADPDALLAALNASDTVIAGELIYLVVTASIPWTELAATPWATLVADSRTWNDLTEGTFTP